MRLSQFRYWLTMLLTLGLLTFIAFPTVATSLAAAETTLVFSQGNHLYQQGRYAQAVTTYQTLLKSGYESGNLYFNLGNAYYKLGQKGRAILYYEKARRLIPEDADLQANLNFVWSKLPTDQTGWPQDFNSWIVHLQPLDRELAITSSLFFLLLALIIGLILVPKHSIPNIYWAVTLCLVTVAFAIGCTITLVTMNYQNRNIAVAVAAGTVRYEPSQTATAFYHLPEGAQVEIIAKQSGWLKVKRPDHKQGWVEQANLIKI